jgi:hypothetical protein
MTFDEICKYCKKSTYDFTWVVYFCIKHQNLERFFFRCAAVFVHFLREDKNTKFDEVVAQLFFYYYRLLFIILFLWLYSPN